MKTILIYGILAVALIAACNDPEEKKMKEIVGNAEVVVSQDEDTCTDSGYQIYMETATIWEQSWAAVYNTSENPLHEKRWFSKADLDALWDMDPSAEDVRLYYCLIDSSDVIPSLAMVNINLCDDVTDCEIPCVLISEIDGSQYFVTAQTASQYTKNWRDRSIDQLEVHTPVYAYNYSQEEIANLMDANSLEKQGIWVKYGLRTLGPGDTNLYTETKEPANDTITGSIVYCNVIYGDDPGKNVRQYFDFALPCPRFCGGSGLLNSD